MTSNNLPEKDKTTPFSIDVNYPLQGSMPSQNYLVLKFSYTHTNGINELPGFNCVKYTSLKSLVKQNKNHHNCLHLIKRSFLLDHGTNGLGFGKTSQVGSPWSICLIMNICPTNWRAVGIHHWKR